MSRFLLPYQYSIFSFVSREFSVSYFLGLPEQRIYWCGLPKSSLSSRQSPTYIVRNHILLLEL